MPLPCASGDSGRWHIKLYGVEISYAVTRTANQSDLVTFTFDLSFDLGSGVRVKYEL